MDVTVKQLSCFHKFSPSSQRTFLTLCSLLLYFLQVLLSLEFPDQHSLSLLISRMWLVFVSPPVLGQSILVSILLNRAPSVFFPQTDITIYTHTRTHPPRTHTHPHTHTQASTYTHAHSRTHAHTHHTRTRAHTPTHTHAHTLTRTHARASTHKHTLTICNNLCLSTTNNNDCTNAPQCYVIPTLPVFFSFFLARPLS